jgi:putative DNA primase/helicase
MLPLPLLHRSVVISMQRSSAQLRRLDEASQVFNLAREAIRKWSASVQLAQDPEMPPALRNRAADNWRILISIADSLGHGEDARAAAVALSADRPDEDAGVVLLTDIRTIFQARNVDRIGSAALIEALVELGDGRWAEFRGVNDDRPPRKLTQPQLALLLRPFGIGSRTIWPLQRKPSDKSSRGYLQSQFELAWRAYCFAADTPTQPSKIMELSGP